uniref:Uncharacterized protein n=1 Tax=Trichuris muris TaxID=70415 RepID=A0A5S6QSA8_TRIMR
MGKEEQYRTAITNIPVTLTASVNVYASVPFLHSCSLVVSGRLWNAILSGETIQLCKGRVNMQRGGSISGSVWRQSVCCLPTLRSCTSSPLSSVR